MFIVAVGLFLKSNDHLAQSTSFGYSVRPPCRSNYTPVLGPGQSWRSFQTSLDVTHKLNEYLALRFGVGYSLHQLDFNPNYWYTRIEFNALTLNPEIQFLHFCNGWKLFDLKMLAGCRTPLIYHLRIQDRFSQTSEEIKKMNMLDAYFGLSISRIITPALSLEIAPVLIDNCFASINQEPFWTRDFSTRQFEWCTIRINYFPKPKKS